MRLRFGFVVLGALALAPASAMAFVWPWNPPAIPEAEARMIAMSNGVASIDDIDGTMDGDWSVEGHDMHGNEVELTIDGSTGAIENAEMDAD